MEEFFLYLYERRSHIIFYGILVLLLTVAFFLYELPVAAVLYPCCLGLILAFGFLMMGFLREHRKVKELKLAQKAGVTDVSELPSADNALEKEYRNTVELMIEKAEKERIKADDSYASMIDYYTMWVHQIKTPIASMRLKLQNEDSPMTRWLRLDLSRIEAYVEMVLAYLRLDSESTDFVICEFDVDECIRTSIKKFSGEFINRGLSLNYMPVGIKALSDEKWLSFVIEQLLSNALKYTPEGGITIDAEGSVLRITDTGIGIAASDLPRVFERGYTGFTGREDKNASGLGLFLCKRICDKLGHKLSITSEQGKGTTVCLDLSKAKYDFD